jgi:hypothetical protein
MPTTKGGIFHIVRRFGGSPSETNCKIIRQRGYSSGPDAGRPCISPNGLADRFGRPSPNLDVKYSDTSRRRRSERNRRHRRGSHWHRSAKPAMSEVAEVRRRVSEILTILCTGRRQEGRRQGRRGGRGARGARHNQPAFARTNKPAFARTVARRRLRLTTLTPVAMGGLRSSGKPSRPHQPLMKSKPR